MTRAELQQVKQRFGIIGNTEALSRAIDIAIQVAPTDLSVLITGESGVGKESFPQIIHQYSRRKHGQYIAVNCGAIPEGTIDSELFGHEKGAFTGAIGERKGYFGEADGGTIFLDEVGELPMPTKSVRHAYKRRMCVLWRLPTSILRKPLRRDVSVKTCTIG